MRITCPKKTNVTSSKTVSAYNVAGMFAGIGGFELGFERAGHKTVLLCEINDEAKNVLRKKFPGVKLATDIRVLKKLPHSAEVVTAGFPCQDLSQAGGTAGISGGQSKLVWEVLRLVAQSKP